MFDIFYFGKKPNVSPHESQVNSIDEAREKSRTRYFWILNYLSDYSGFDFLWEPAPWDSQYIHAWPSQWQKDGGTYLVPKDDNCGVKYQNAIIPRIGYSDAWEIDSNIEIEDFDYTWHPDPTDPPYIYQFGTQHQKTGGPRYVVPNASEVKYERSIIAKKVSIDNNWEIDGEIEIDGFDYTWHPDYSNPPYIYQFGTQHQKTGGPRYVVNYASDIKYVENILADIKSGSAKVIYLIDHYDQNIDQSINSVKDKNLEIIKTRFSSNYLNTIRRIAKKAKDEHEYVWVCSSVCDYTHFNFSWHPEQWQSRMIHVFPSNEQKFGDTFFIHIPSLLEQMNIELLEWHNINFVDQISVPRWNCPEVIHGDDNHIDAIKQQELRSPLTLFSCQKSNANSIPTIPLWDEKKKTITPLSLGARSVIVPRESIATIDKQLYDYPHIDKRFTNTIKDTPIDIIFISNGETNAEENWKHLISVVSGKSNRVARVDGIDGRVAAYQAALKESNTDWAFCVFAKLKVNEDFDWSWQPDRMQQRKHYIFHAKNPVNHLEYGHMAMIAYNKKLTLQNIGHGLDFTLDQEHDVVPLLSGTAEFNNDPWMTWRTAFRECLKLRDSLPDIENEYRLETWREVSDGKNGEWSVRGAEDAIKYYESVNGDFDKLKLSYDWEWLEKFFKCEYSQ